MALARRTQPDQINVGDTANDRYGVRAVERTARLLTGLAEGDGRPKSLSELARHADMPEPTALRYLATLARLGLAEREGSGTDSRYRLGLGVFTLAQRAVGNSDVRATALPYMQSLRERYRETVNLAIFRQHRLLIIEVLEGLRSIRQGARVGEQDRLRSTALGKAVLATYPDDEALSLLRTEPIEHYTPRTIMTDVKMIRELHAIRTRGYAIDDEESETGLRCVGVAIPGRLGTVFGLSISGPSHLFTLKAAHEAGPVLVTVRDELIRQLNPGGAP